MIICSPKKIFSSAEQNFQYLPAIVCFFLVMQFYLHHEEKTFPSGGKFVYITRKIHQHKTYLNQYCKTAFYNHISFLLFYGIPSSFSNPGIKQFIVYCKHVNTLSSISAHDILFGRPNFFHSTKIPFHCQQLSNNKKYFSCIGTKYFIFRFFKHNIM